jgi:chemotaxis protein MotB
VNPNKSIKSAEQESGSEASWLTTFNDLVTLLMVFFVLLFTMSTLDTRKLKSFQGSLQSGLGILKAGQKVSVGVIEPEKNIQAPAKQDIEDSIRNLDSLPGVATVYTDEGIKITLEDKILFQSGVSDINKMAFPILDKIITVLKSTSQPIRVEGHTDNDPIHTERFPSNWELSTARAVNVVKYFTTAGPIAPERLSAVGYGQSRPLFVNDTPEHKAKNRRVEIVLVTQEED